MKIKGISRGIIDILTERSNSLGQGRSAGVIGICDEKGYVSSIGKVIDGGLSGLPFRSLLSGIMELRAVSLLELINQLPANAIVISSSPGKTGIIVSTSGINIFNLPIIKIGIKNKTALGVGIIEPKSRLFALATESERVQLNTLAALNMEEERQALRESSKLRLKFLEISEELAVVDCPLQQGVSINNNDIKWNLPRNKVRGINKNFAEKLVQCSTEVEQGREVAAIGLLDQEGFVIQGGKIIAGGMGYVPSRLLACSYHDVSNLSLREAYTDIIPMEAVIVHTHPGGTGVMHMGDAVAGPGTWGRPIIAIGHDNKGEIKGATVIEFTERISCLTDEYEEIEQRFFRVESAEEESRLRKRRYEIAQDFTDLCREIEIK